MKLTGFARTLSKKYIVENAEGSSAVDQPKILIPV